MSKDTLSAVRGDIVANGGAVVADVAHASVAMLHCFGTFSTVNVTFEGSLDGGLTWFGVRAVRTNAGTIESATGNLSAAPAYAWKVNVAPLSNLRVRATAWTSGTQTWLIALTEADGEPFVATDTHAVTVTGTATTTPANGSTYNAVTTASTNAAAPKTSGGNLYEITVSNPTATAAYVKLYNKASAPTVGTDVPVLTIPAPAGATQQLEFGAVGKRFATGIAIACTAAAVATDTAVAVAGVQINATYI